MAPTILRLRVVLKPFSKQEEYHITAIGSYGTADDLSARVVDPVCADVLVP